jgi:hypothetical protein
MPEPEYVTFRMARTANDGTITSRGERVAGVLFTVRRAKWVRGYLQAIAEGLTGKAAALAGGRYGGIGGSTHLPDLVVTRKMETFLANPDVQQAIRSVYEEVGFSLEDAVKLHLRHIKGDISHEEVTKDGDVVEVKHAPNYPALKDWLAVATPREPKRVNVLTARVGIARESRTDGSPPAMAARAIGEIIDAT